MRLLALSIYTEEDGRVLTADQLRYMPSYSRITPLLAVGTLDSRPLIRGHPPLARVHVPYVNFRGQIFILMYRSYI